MVSQGEVFCAAQTVECQCPRGHGIMCTRRCCGGGIGEIVQRHGRDLGFGGRVELGIARFAGQALRFPCSAVRGGGEKGEYC